MKFEIEITEEFKQALEQVLHKALLQGGATSLKEVNIITNTFNNIKEIQNDRSN
jgi:hypothetical protein